MDNVQLSMAVNVNGITANYIIICSLAAFEALSLEDISLVFNVVGMGKWGWRDITYAFSVK